MSIRDEFEAWAKTDAGGLEEDDFRWMSAGKYYWATTQMMWEAWQASRSVLVVKLPSLREITMGRRENEHDSGFNAAVDLCIDVVESAGIKVKK